MDQNGHDVIEAHDLVKIYRRGSEKIAAVNRISLNIAKGEFVSFVGPSGSGKTTVINLLGCLDNPTSGGLHLAGHRVFGEKSFLSERELTILRRQFFGYVFQKFYLIPTLTVRENITLPLLFYAKPGAAKGVDYLLNLLGLEHRQNHLPGQISGGEMQRVAIARALVNRPEILLADEPTGNLDTKRSEEIGHILKELNVKEGITVVLVSHNPNLAKVAHRIIELRDGEIYAGQDKCEPKEGCA